MKERITIQVGNILDLIEQADDNQLALWFREFRQEAEKNYALNVPCCRDAAGVFDHFAILIATKRRELAASSN